MTRSTRIRHAIQTLNSLYGRGDVRRIEAYMDGRIVFYRQPFGMRTEKRNARIVGDTVFALGHQRKLVSQ